MYVFGHIALAYLPISVYLAIAKKRLEPSALLAVLFFANMQDSIHIGIVREFSHNFLGSVLMFVGVFLLLRKVGLVEGRDAPIMAFAASCHVVGDFLFSGFNPFFPFVDAPITVWGFNSLENIMAEAALGVLFVTVAYALGDWRRLRPHVAERVKKFYQQKWFPVFDHYYYPLYLFALMLSVSIIEFAIGVRYNAFMAVEGKWNAIVFLAGFYCYLLALGSSLIVKRTANPRP